MPTSISIWCLFEFLCGSNGLYLRPWQVPMTKRLKLDDWTPLRTSQQGILMPQCTQVKVVWTKYGWRDSCVDLSWQMCVISYLEIPPCWAYLVLGELEWGCGWCGADASSWQYLDRTFYVQEMRLHYYYCESNWPWYLYIMLRLRPRQQPLWGIHQHRDKCSRRCTQLDKNR